MSEIFISYANQDRARIRPLVDALEASGWSVFWDVTLLPGETWRRKIEDELAKAECVIVIWSANSIRSHWVEEEAGEGRQRGILVPAVIDQVAIPLGFRSWQAANLIGWDGAIGHTEFAKMLRAISSHAPLVRPAAATLANGIGEQALKPKLFDNLIAIPAGTFWMGAQKTVKNARNYDPGAYEWDSPVHQVTLRAFRIARFPVTVKEFAAFVNGGGYDTEKHWTAGGFGVEKVPERWATQQERSDSPVVGVRWYEVAAYSSWADLLGNVWEWCGDFYGKYPSVSEENPAGRKKGEFKILRGGS